MIIRGSKEYFVTVCSYSFLPQVVTLYRSLSAVCARFELWIICVDSSAFELLSKCQLDDVRLLNLELIESSDLKSFRATRSLREFCWTLSPYAPKLVFDTCQEAQRVTYIDADLWFRKSPKLIFDEFLDSKKGVLITEHAFFPVNDMSATSGKYCVQFMIFDRIKGERVRRWWEDRCAEWCFAKHEDGKFGDQLYLDDWDERFPNEVCVMSRPNLILAPWNVFRFPYGDSCVWHFHGTRLARLNGKYIIYTGQPLPKVVIDNVYAPYAEELKNSCFMLEKFGFIVQPQHSLSLSRVVKDYLKAQIYPFIGQCGIHCETLNR